ncbi:MAG: biotin transporter BioY, partial [bacterium]
MTTDRSTQLRLTVYAALFAALISAGAFMAIPIGPVPIVLQNMFVLLAGVLLGWKWGAASVLIYLLAGAVGFPVFSAGRGGVAHLLGPTGGYLLSYIPAVIVAG